MSGSAVLQSLAAGGCLLARGTARRGLRTGRPAAQQIISQARKDLSELLSLGNK